MKMKPPRETISVKIDVSVMNKVRRILYTRRAKKIRPWSQAEAFTEAMKVWLKGNPK